MSDSILWVDSHCHLDSTYLPEQAPSVDELVQRALSNQVKWLMSVGTDLESATRVRQYSERYPRVFHSVGIHPHEAHLYDKAAIEPLRQLTQHKKCKAIGEIGLDYYYDHSPREAQISLFRAQLELAAETDLPVIIHCRDAEADMLEILKQFKTRGVIHCFTGTQGFGEACLNLGYYISFSGILTFKNSEKLRECAQNFDINRLLVETDAPYLAPVPYRGKRCEPSMVKMTGLKLAEIKALTPFETATITTRNAEALFRIEAIGDEI